MSNPVEEAWCIDNWDWDALLLLIYSWNHSRKYYPSPLTHYQIPVDDAMGIGIGRITVKATRIIIGSCEIDKLIFRLVEKVKLDTMRSEILHSNQFHFPRHSL